MKLVKNTKFYKSVAKTIIYIYFIFIKKTDPRLGYKTHKSETQNDFDFLIAHGLKPDSMLLDYGCGGGRVGIPLINYLEAGCYVGLDKEAFMIREFKRSIERQQLQQKFPKLICDDQFEYRASNYDFIYAYSVFTHLPREALCEALRTFKPLLKADGQVVFSYLLGADYIAGGKHEDRPGELQGVWYSQQILADIAEKEGFIATFFGDDSKNWEGVSRTPFDEEISTHRSKLTWSPFWTPLCDEDKCGVGRHTHGAHQEMVGLKVAR